MSNGKYICDDRGNPVGAVGDEETLARILFKLTAKRGQFPFLPELGSRLYMLGNEKKAARKSAALGYVAEALRDEADIEVKDVALTETSDGISVTAYLTKGGEKIQVQVMI